MEVLRAPDIEIELPKAPARPAPPVGISADALARRIDEFLTSKGYKAPAAPPAQTADESEKLAAPSETIVAPNISVTDLPRAGEAAPVQHHRHVVPIVHSAPPPPATTTAATKPAPAGSAFNPESM